MPKRKKSKINELLYKREEISPFVIDLRKKVEGVIKDDEKEKKSKRHRIFTHFFKKKKEEQKKESLKKRLSYKLKNLAIFNIFRFFFAFGVFSGKIFYNLCYAIGWITVYFVKFVYLLVLKIASPVFSFFSYSVFFLKKIAPFIKNILQKIVIFPGAAVSRFKIKSKKKKIEAYKKEYREYHEEKVEEEKDKGAIPGKRVLKKAFIFALVLIVIVLPFKFINFYETFNLDELKAKVLGDSENGINNLMAASQSISDKNFNLAQADFGQAGDDFLKAKSQLNEINGFLLTLASIAPDKNLRMAAEANNILTAGNLASEMGANLSAAFGSFADRKGKNLKEILDNFMFYGNKATKNASDLRMVLGKIDVNNLPPEYRDKFAFMRDKSVILEKSLGEFMDLANKFENFAGMTENKRYLLVFQNNGELRATGGFIGSFATVDFVDGKLTNIFAPGGGSYDTAGGLRKLVAAPEPLDLVNPLWHFWDANWWPDWPTSARKLMWFYEESEGSTVDGVVSFTPDVMETLLKAIGPIDMRDKYGVIVDADNFWTVTQTFSEQKPGKTKQPKKIIGDLMKKIIAELPSRLNEETLVQLINGMEKNLDEKQILLYFKDGALEKEVSDYGWDGKVKDVGGDYFMVVNTNIAGGKSDRKIEEKVSHEASVESDGSIIDTVKIERTHTGIKNEPFTGVRNVDWMRIYVPLGSQLIEAQGFEKPDQSLFGVPDPSWEHDGEVLREESTARTDPNSGTEIYAENGHTVFANWSMVDPGGTVDIYLKYKLPFVPVKKTDDSFLGKIKNYFGYDENLYPYSLFIQKQPGAKPDDFLSGFNVNNGDKIIWSSDGSDENAYGRSSEFQLSKDSYQAVLLQD